MSEPRTLSGRLFQSLGAKYEKALPPLVDFAILGTRGAVKGGKVRTILRAHDGRGPPREKRDFYRGER